MIDDYDGPPQPHMPRQGFIDIASCPNIRQGMLTSAGFFRDEIERDQACWQALEFLEMKHADKAGIQKIKHGMGEKDK